MVLEQLDVPMQKNKPRQRHHDFPKIHSKMDHRYKSGTQTIKMLEENFAEYLCDLGSFNKFF